MEVFGGLPDDKSGVGKCNTDVVMFAVVDGEDFEIEVVEPDDEFFVAKLLENKWKKSINFMGYRDKREF